MENFPGADFPKSKIRFFIESLDSKHKIADSFSVRFEKGEICSFKAYGTQPDLLNEI